ncbi:ABC transporter permease [Compostibacter hankyongensis]|uniref:ABC transporter permease n=1 Tax=Compostibacter hankyongensis TaxID=1007089 RepID=A0ABP8FHM8_9BACT
MNFTRFIFNLRIGIDALMNNRSRAVLTSLGIIFGVASVIAMLAIGNGAEKEILEQIKEVGANNIIIKPQTDDARNQQSNDDKSDAGDAGTGTDNSSASGSSRPEGNITKRNTSPGLDMEDVTNMLTSIPSINYISPEVEIHTQFMYGGHYRDGRLVGVNNNFFALSNIQAGEGRLFNDRQLRHAEQVCIIGKNIKTRLFATNDPIGQFIKCGSDWMRIVGVLEGKDINTKDIQKLSIRNINDDVYIPIQTMLLRYRNRSLVTPNKVKAAARHRSRGNYNQLDRVVVNVKQSDMMQATTGVINRLLLRRHNGIQDYEIVVPELLLKQEQKTKSLFNVVLAIIASISLIVGGIGIMNIMLASVLERTREIGLRLAIGATKKDIVTQFVSEAICISLTGGLIGVMLGILLSVVIEQATSIQTIISPVSIVVSFSISIAVGLFFGILPAKRASNYDPVVALRHD